MSLVVRCIGEGDLKPLTPLPLHRGRDTDLDRSGPLRRVTQLYGIIMGPPIFGRLSEMTYIRTTPKLSIVTYASHYTYRSLFNDLPRVVTTKRSLASGCGVLQYSESVAPFFPYRLEIQQDCTKASGWPVYQLSSLHARERLLFHRMNCLFLGADPREHLYLGCLRLPGAYSVRCHLDSPFNGPFISYITTISHPIDPVSPFIE